MDTMHTNTPPASGREPRTIATYSDGSGHYTITVQGDVMTTTIADHTGYVFETFSDTMVRDESLDDSLATGMHLTPEYAASEDMGEHAVAWLATDLDGTPAGEGPWFAYVLVPIAGSLANY